MVIELSTKLGIIDHNRSMASIHILFCGGSFTIANILLKKAANDRWQISMPLTDIRGNKRPMITLQGALKQAVFKALMEDHEKLRCSTTTRSERHHIFDQEFQLITSSE